jgi:cytidine deaminase
MKKANEAFPADLLKLAKKMRARAYAPYSKFAVGAAVRGKSGKLYGGCNVENAAYPVGICAEAGAISAMVAGGDSEIAEILVLAGGDELVSPCGACRQRIREFAKPKTPVHLAREAGSGETVTLKKLLPMSFGPGHLK